MKNTLRKNLGLSLFALVALSLPLYSFTMMARDYNRNVDAAIDVAETLNGRPEQEMLATVETLKDIEGTHTVDVTQETAEENLSDTTAETNAIDFETAEGIRYKITPPGFEFAGILSYAIFPAALLLLIAFILTVYFAKRAEREDLQPARDLMHYLVAVVSGNFDEDIEVPDFSDAFDKYFRNGQSKREFERAITEIRENELLRRQFSANVSHELKSPLTSINGYAEMIESGMVDTEDAQRFAAIIHKEGIRLLNMINETIQLSKFDTGYSDFDTRTELDIAKITLEEVASLSQVAQEHGVQIAFDGHSTMMHGNERSISDVIRNLISNAIKYSKPEGGKIDIKLTDDPSSITWSIQDTGIGIALEDQARVFERFYVVDKARTRQSGTGTGLGLSLVKHTVQSYGGTVTLKSRRGVGSLFTITLPKNQETQQSEA